jgi:hypothetical protein
MMKVAVFMAVPIMAFAGESSADAALFSRQCNMVCDHAVQWFDTLDAARAECRSSSDCGAVVDHSANKGKFGICASGSSIQQGSDRNDVFRNVCVERKAGGSVSMLQTAATKKDLAGSAVKFSRQCDTVCDSVSDWFDSMSEAQASCASNAECAAVIDHSVNHGKFGLCKAGASFSKGSDKSETFRRVCVEHKG